MGIDATHTQEYGLIDTINAYSDIHARSYIENRIADVCVRHRRVRACVSVPVRIGAYWRVRIGIEPCQPIPTRGPRAARFAGILLGVCVQCKHRRLERRVCFKHA
jgi:hypothetical protein